MTDRGRNDRRIWEKAEVIPPAPEPPKPPTDEPVPQQEQELEKVDTEEAE